MAVVSRCLRPSNEPRRVPSSWLLCPRRTYAYSLRHARKRFRGCGPPDLPRNSRPAGCRLCYPTLSGFYNEFRLSRILSDGFERTLTKLLNGIQEVDRSIPFRSTNKIKHLASPLQSHRSTDVGTIARGSSLPPPATPTGARCLTIPSALVLASLLPDYLSRLRSDWRAGRSERGDARVTVKFANSAIRSRAPALQFFRERGRWVCRRRFHPGPPLRIP